MAGKDPTFSSRPSPPAFPSILTAAPLRNFHPHDAAASFFALCRESDDEGGDWFGGKLKFKKHVDDAFRRGGDGRDAGDYLVLDSRTTDLDAIDDVKRRASAKRPRDDDRGHHSGRGGSGGQWGGDRWGGDRRGGHRESGRGYCGEDRRRDRLRSRSRDRGRGDKGFSSRRREKSRSRDRGDSSPQTSNHDDYL